MGFSVGLLAVSIAVAAAVLFVALPRVGKPGPETLFLRLTGVSGVAAVASSVMYLIYRAGGGLVALVVGDAAMVLAPALLFIALRVLDGKQARLWSVAVVALELGVAVVSAVVPQPPSAVVKVAVLAVVCGTCAVAAARSGVELWAPMRVIMLTCGAYAVFCVARLFTGAVFGMDSAIYGAVFSFPVVTVVGATAVLLIGIAVVRLFVGRAGVSMRSAVRAPGTTVVLGDWDLASAAYGTDRMRALVGDLREAARTVDPEAADVPRGVELGTPQPVTVLAEILRSGYGWSADEITLLIDGASTGAIRTTARGQSRRSVRRPPRT